MAGIKGKDSGKCHSQPIDTLVFQLYLAMHAEMKTVFLGGCWGAEPPINSLIWQFRHANHGNLIDE